MNAILKRIDGGCLDSRRDPQREIKKVDRHLATLMMWHQNDWEAIVIPVSIDSNFEIEVMIPMLLGMAAQCSLMS
jgi:hypothetical protein